jgi:hypothetical protein
MGIIIRKRMDDGLYSYLSSGMIPRYPVKGTVPAWPFADNSTKWRWVPSISDADDFAPGAALDAFKQKYAAGLTGADYIDAATHRHSPSRLK